MEFVHATKVAQKRGRRRLFGPLLYGTLALGVLELIGLWCYRQWPTWQKRLDARRYAAQLGDPVLAVRDRAAEELRTLGKEADGPILDALRSGNAQARESACRLLWTSGLKPQEKVEAFCRALNDPEPKIRRIAAGSIPMTRRLLARGTYNWAPAVAALKRLVNDRDVYVSTAASWSLTELGEEAKVALPDIEATLTHPEPAARLFAARALLRISGERRPDAEACLWRLVHEQDDTDRYSIHTEAAGELLRVDPALESQVLRSFVLTSCAPTSNIRRRALGCLSLLTGKGRRDLPTLSEPKSLLPFLVVHAYGNDRVSRVIAINIIADVEPRVLPLVFPPLLQMYLFPSLRNNDRPWAGGVLDRMGLRDFRHHWLYEQAVLNDYLNGVLGFDVFAR